MKCFSIRKKGCCIGAGENHLPNTTHRHKLLCSLFVAQCSDWALCLDTEFSAAVNSPPHCSSSTWSQRATARIEEADWTLCNRCSTQHPLAVHPEPPAPSVLPQLSHKPHPTTTTLKWIHYAFLIVCLSIRLISVLDFCKLFYSRICRFPSLLFFRGSQLKECWFKV